MAAAREDPALPGTPAQEPVAGAPADFDDLSPTSASPKHAKFTDTLRDLGGTRSPRLLKKKLESTYLVVKPTDLEVDGYPLKPTLSPRTHEDSASKCSLAYFLFLAGSLVQCTFSSQLKRSWWKWIIIYCICTCYLTANFFTNWLFAKYGQDAIAAMLSLFGMPVGMMVLYIFLLRPAFAWDEDQYGSHPRVMVTVFGYAIISTPFMYMSTIGVRDREITRFVLAQAPVDMNCTANTQQRMTDTQQFIQFAPNDYQVEYWQMTGYYPPGDPNNPNPPAEEKVTPVRPEIRYCIFCSVPITPTQYADRSCPFSNGTFFIASFYHCQQRLQPPSNLTDWCWEAYDNNTLSNPNATAMAKDSLLFERTQRIGSFRPYTSATLTTGADLRTNATYGAPNATDNYQTVQLFGCMADCWLNRAGIAKRRAQFWGLALAIVWVAVEPILLLLNRVLQIHILGPTRV